MAVAPPRRKMSHCDCCLHLREVLTLLLLTFALVVPGNDACSPSSNMSVRHVASLAELKKGIAVPAVSILDFFATWCGPCKMIAPKYSELSAKYPHVGFYSIDVDKMPDAAQEYRVRAMPTFVFCKQGNELERFEGADINMLEATLKRLAPAGPPPIPDDATLEAMKPRELLALLATLRVPSTGMVEKTELVNAIKAQRR